MSVPARSARQGPSEPDCLSQGGSFIAGAARNEAGWCGLGGADRDAWGRMETTVRAEVVDWLRFGSSMGEFLVCFDDFRRVFDANRLSPLAAGCSQGPGAAALLLRLLVCCGRRLPVPMAASSGASVYSRLRGLTGLT